MRKLRLAALWTRSQVDRMQGVMRPLGAGSRLGFLFYWEHKGTFVFKVCRAGDGI
jgi:hypothetical protein